MAGFITLEGGDRMPSIGFGTWQLGGEELEKAVDYALTVGYRHFDTARAYENEAALGRSLRRWIGDDPAVRKSLFVVTKLPPGGNRAHLVPEYFEASLKDLGLDYVDMYLLHTPFGFEHVPGDLHPKHSDGSMKVDLLTDLVGVWKSICKLKETGKVRHVGVANVNEEQLLRLCTVEKPACIQLEIHVRCQQKDMVQTAGRLGIPIVAYSPLGSKSLAQSRAEKTGRTYTDLLSLEVVKGIADNHFQKPAQVLLRFCLQRGIAAIPKSTKPEHIKQNISLWDFQLSQDEMAELSALDLADFGRICDFSFFPGVEKHHEFPFKK